MKKKTHTLYRLSFTCGGGLFLSESSVIVPIYLECRDWILTRTRSLNEPALYYRMKSSLQRKVREILPRLQTLSIEELEFFQNEASLGDRRYLLWISVCPTYPFIADFATHVLREKFLELNLKIDPVEFDFFYEKLIPFHPELEERPRSTYKKLKSSLFLILREAGILNSNFEILNNLPSTTFNQIVFYKHPEYIQYFPIHESFLRNQ